MDTLEPETAGSLAHLNMAGASLAGPLQGTRFFIPVNQVTCSSVQN